MPDAPIGREKIFDVMRVILELYWESSGIERGTWHNILQWVICQSPDCLESVFVQRLNDRLVRNGLPTLRG